MTPEEYLKRRKEIERLTREEERDRGRLEECLKRVRKLAGTDDLRKARKVLAGMNAEVESGQSRIDALCEEWDAEYKDKLGDA